MFITRLCRIGRLPASVVLRLVRDHVSETPVPMNQIARKIPDEVMEELPNGLKTFLLSRPDTFAVFPVDGVLHARRKASSEPTTQRCVSFKALVVPSFIVSVADCAEVWKTSLESATARIVRLAPYANLVPLERNGFPKELFVLPNPAIQDRYDCKVADNTFASYKVQLYDVCRLARCLTTYSFTPWAELHEKAQPLLLRPLTQVVMSAPERFIFNTEGVKYKLSLEVDLHTATRYTEADLHERLQRAEEMENREKRRQAMRLLYLKRNPFGSPMMDRDVLALYIFDSLPATGLSASAIKGMLVREFGEILPNKYMSIFNNFPNLFVLKSIGNQRYHVFRADAAPETRSVESLSDEELAQVIISFGPEHRLREHPLDTRHWFGSIPDDVYKTLLKRHGSCYHFVKSVPKYFVIESEIASNRVGENSLGDNLHCTYFYTADLRETMHEEHIRYLQLKAEELAGEKRS